MLFWFLIVNIANLKHQEPRARVRSCQSLVIGCSNALDVINGVDSNIISVSKPPWLKISKHVRSAQKNSPGTWVLMHLMCIVLAFLKPNTPEHAAHYFHRRTLNSAACGDALLLRCILLPASLYSHYPRSDWIFWCIWCVSTVPKPDTDSLTQTIVFS